MNIAALLESTGLLPNFLSTRARKTYLFLSAFAAYMRYCRNTTFIASSNSFRSVIVWTFQLVIVSFIFAVAGSAMAQSQQNVSYRVCVWDHDKEDRDKVTVTLDDMVLFDNVELKILPIVQCHDGKKKTGSIHIVN